MRTGTGSVKAPVHAKKATSTPVTRSRTPSTRTASTGNPKKLYVRKVGVLKVHGVDSAGRIHVGFSHWQTQVHQTKRSYNKGQRPTARTASYLQKSNDARLNARVAGGVNRKTQRAASKAYAAKAGYRKAHYQGKASAGYTTYKQVHHHKRTQYSRGYHGRFA
jgi:hypothetical protein